MAGVFGWNYPAGAENDPRAPWNQDESGECESEGCREDAVEGETHCRVCIDDAIGEEKYQSRRDGE